MSPRSLTLLPAAAFLLAFAPSSGAAPGKTARPITLTASSAPSIVLGGPVGIKGRVTPGVAGIRLTLEQQQGTGWQSVASGRARSGGFFSFTARPRQAGTATFRVTTAHGSNFAGTSAAVPVQVFEWTFLGNLYVRPDAGDLNTDPVVSNGVTYSDPVVLDAGCYNAWGGSAWVDYDLGRHYQTFTATVGLGDTQVLNGTATFRVDGDGKTLASGSLLPGMSTKVSVSLSGVSKLRLFSNVPDPTGAAGCGSYFLQVVFGDAQVLGPSFSS